MNHHTQQKMFLLDTVAMLYPSRAKVNIVECLLMVLKVATSNLFVLFTPHITEKLFDFQQRQLLFIVAYACICSCRLHPVCYSRRNIRYCTSVSSFVFVPMLVLPFHCYDCFSSSYISFFLFFSAICVERASISEVS